MIRPGRLARGMAAAVLAAALATTAAPAQQRGLGPGMGPGPQDRQQLERRVRARFAEMMRQRLGLSDEQSQRLNQTVDSFAERRQRLMSDDQALRRRMEAIALEEEPTDAEARALLARMEELRRQEVELFQEEQGALMEVLTPVQLVRFHAMREQLGRRIQQLREGQGPMPGRPPRGRPPGGSGPDPDEWHDDEGSSAPEPPAT